MKALNSLINDIQSAPLWADCSTCHGTGEMQSDVWAGFFKRYGVDAMKPGSKFALASMRAVMEEVGELNRQAFFTNECGLNRMEAADLDDYMASPDMVKCSSCSGEKRKVTELGAKVKKLKELLNGI